MQNYQEIKNKYDGKLLSLRNDCNQLQEKKNDIIRKRNQSHKLENEVSASGGGDA